MASSADLCVVGKLEWVVELGMEAVMRPLMSLSKTFMTSDEGKRPGIIWANSLLFVGTGTKVDGPAIRNVK